MLMGTADEDILWSSPQNAAIVMVKGGGPTIKKHNFKDAEAYLNQWEPVTKNCNTNSKHGSDEISDASGGVSQIPATIAKKERGSTGIGFCYYEYDEFKLLSK